MEKERFVPLYKYYGRYSISNYGRVIDTMNQTEVEQNCSADGQPRVKLLDANGSEVIERESYQTAIAFLPRRDFEKKNKLIHKDNNWNNNYFENLEWREIE